MEKAKVYFTEEITPEALQKIYHALGVTLRGKVAVKISTGEPGGHNFLQPALIAPLVQELNGTIVECNTLPITGGKRLKENFVGKNLQNYDSMLMLSHFKGHPMAGLGGALKNMSIGVASAHGKQWIHTSGSGETSFEALMKADHVGFLESMADADQSVMAYMGAKNIVYINVANRLSVDCDCCEHPAEPEMMDIGIFASLDPVAVDQACVDAVYASKDPGKAALIERMESRQGVRTIEAAGELNLGTRAYEVIKI